MMNEANETFSEVTSYLKKNPEAKLVLLSVYNGWDSFKGIREDVSLPESSVRKSLKRLESYDIISIHGPTETVRLTDKGTNFQGYFYKM
jgi:predicted transcriptional regulator